MINIFNNYKTIPLVFDESLSYYEQVCILVKHVQDLTEETHKAILEIIKDNNEFQKETLEMIDVRITELESEYNRIFTEFETRINGEWDEYKTDINGEWDEYKTDINGEWDEYKTDINEQMADMKAQFTTFKTQVIEAFNSYRIEMNQMMEAYKTETSAEIAVALAEITTTMNESLERYNEEIKAWVSEYFQNVNVWNPVIGMETTINKAISDLYDLFRGPTAITCAEFDALVGYNCSIFDAMGYTAKEFDIGFKTIIENN